MPSLLSFLLLTISDAISLFSDMFECKGNTAERKEDIFANNTAALTYDHMH